MNKKFLSAILFGALMVTSTGTFVSCKDYDDDIDAIHKELTDIKSQISALQTKVDAGNYVTNITKAEGGINVAFSNGSTNFVATGAVVETEECYASAATIVDGEWVINKADGTSVPTGIPASGVLVTGSEATGFVLSVVNAAGEITEVKLPTASSTLESITVVTGRFAAPSAAIYNSTASTKGIFWGVAGSELNWGGPLGKVAKNQLLVGQIDYTYLTVKPLTYDLSAQELKFVDNQGNVAPVEVAAYPMGGKWITAGSRAADKKGEWALAIALTSDVNKDNVEKAFTVDATDNKLYALMVNGVVASDYAYVIDTWTAAEVAALPTYTMTCNANKVLVNGAAVSNIAYDYGKTHYVDYADITVADAYLSFADADKATAELAGVTVDGLAINAPATAANKEITFTLNVLSANATTAKCTFKMKFKPSTVESGSLAATTYTLTANASKQYIDVNVADFFKTMTAAEVAAYSTWTLEPVADQKNFLLSSVTASTVSTLHKAKDDGTINATEFKPAAGNAEVTSVSYLRIPVAAENINPEAKPGDYKLVLTLKAANGNEIKKAEVPVTIALPAFTDIYTTSAAWEGSTFTTKILKGAVDYYIDLSTAFNAKDNYPLSDLNIVAAKVDDKQLVSDGDLNADDHIILSADVVKEGALRTDKLTAAAYYVFYGSEELVVESEEFTIGLQSQFEAPKLVYYVDGVAKDVATLGEGGVIKTLTVDAEGVKNGLAIQYAKGEQAFVLNNVVDGVKLVAAGSTVSNNEVATATSIKDVTKATVTMGTDVTIVGVTKGTLVAKFTDKLGITTTATIAFE